MKILIATLLLSISTFTFAQKDIKNLRFAVVPQQSASKMAKLWIPILKNLSQQTGLKFHFKTAKDIPTFERRLAEGSYDIAYMNPYHFTVFNHKPGYQALVHAKDKRIKGIMVVRKDSPITSINELTDMTLAFPAPAAFAASILTRTKLASIGNQFTPKYVSSHDSVYRSVAKELYPAGGGVIRTFKNLEPNIKKQLKVLWTTDGFTPHAIASHPRLDQATQDKIANAFVELSKSEEGKKLLNNIKIKGFQKANNEDWNDVKALRIDLLEDLVR